MSLLESIQTPDDVKRLSRDQLPLLAEEIRNFLLHTLARTGGHLGANLGVVELTIALHYLFDSPRDALVWDVSHQIYTHKLLTGRRARFDTLRQLDGLSGFAKPEESEHDAFVAGHGGTSLSSALGLARARAALRSPGRVVAIIGDGSLTSGMALEALNDAGHAHTNLLVVLNDNAMAISPSVGALARYLSRLRSEPSYLRAKESFEALMQRVRGGESVVGMVERVKGSVKQLFMPRMLFEDFGFTYLGPVDGHDIPVLLGAMQQAQRLEGPVMLHVLTTKGKGYSPAENHECRLHGVPAFDLETGQPVEHPDGTTFTEAFGAAMCQRAVAHEGLVAISAAMCDGTGLDEFRRQFPARCLDVGMAEEHAVTMAAGMATAGLRPVVAIYSTFLQRAYDQLLHDVCLPRLPVILALDRAGLVGEDGPTHHGVFDLSYLRMMPHMTVMAPATRGELSAMLDAALRLDGPCAIRYPKARALQEELGDLAGIDAGCAAVLREGDDVALVAIGTMTPVALEAARRLETLGLHATVINARFVKPLDTRCLLAAARRVRLIVTLEENALAGGFGSAVLEMLAAAGVTTPACTLGIPDTFIGQGPRAILLDRLGLSAAGIAEVVASRLRPRIEFDPPRPRPVSQRP